MKERRMRLQINREEGASAAITSEGDLARLGHMVCAGNFAGSRCGTFDFRYRLLLEDRDTFSRVRRSHQFGLFGRPIVGRAAPLDVYSITLRREGRSMLAYLPGDAFWAIQAQFNLEARYQKPSRGLGRTDESLFLLDEPFELVD